MIANAQVAESVIAYARSHNLPKIVIGRDPSRRLWPWQRSSGQRLALLAPDIDLVEIGACARPRGAGASAQPCAPRAAGSPGETGDRRKSKRLRYLWAALACTAVTVRSMPLARALRPLQHRGDLHLDRGARRGALRARAGGAGGGA